MLLAGAGYAGAVLAMQIITIAVIPNGLTGVLGIQVLTALEKEKYVLYSVTLGAIVDLLLNLSFIPQYGAAGAAFATTIAEFTVLAIQVSVTKNMLVEVKSQLRIFSYVVLATLSGIICLAIKVLNVNSTFLLLLLSAITFFGVYCIGLIICKETIVLELIDSIKNKLKKNKRL